MTRMNPQSVLAAFEAQVRRHPGPDGTDGPIERFRKEMEHHSAALSYERAAVVSWVA